MKKKQIDKSWIYGVMVVTLTLVLIILPIQAQAQDADLDGFLETTPIILYDETSSYPPCQQGMDRAFCLDPATKDLFVILVPASGSKIPSNPLEYVSYSMAAKGLGIATHQIESTQANPDRVVSPSSSQKAMLITESIDTSGGTVLGISNYGTPNGASVVGTVYTQRIINHINTVCLNTTDNNKCKDSEGVVRPALYDKYIRHTLAHEAAHMMKLTNVYKSSYGGYHYATGSGNVLDQSVKYTNKNGGVTFYLGTVFTAADQSAAKLSP